MADIQVVNIATLQSQTGMANNTVAEVLGYSSAGDKGGGLFYYDSGSSTTADGGTIIVPNSPTTGRWIRLYNTNECDVRWFGIFPDGSTDQYSALNALLSLSYIQEIVFDEGDYIIGSSHTVTVPSGKKLIFRNGARLVGSGTLDGGIIECDLLKECFATTLTIQNLENSIVSVCWFAAKPSWYMFSGTTSGAYDNLVPFQNAIFSVVQTSGTRVNNAHAKVFMPAASDADHAYYFSDTLVITQNVELFGVGQDQTFIQIEPSTLGFQLTGQPKYLHDFTMNGSLGDYPPNYDDGSSHGILIASPLTRLQRITIQRFRGNGFSIEADVNASPSTNANNGSVEDCRAILNAGSGVYFDGGDANQWRAAGIDASNNGRWGIWDSSFLGNLFVQCHTASNAVENIYNKTAVNHSSQAYVCIQDNTNIEPGVTSGWEAYWFLMGGAGDPTFWSTWNNSTSYKTGGGYYFDNANQLGVAEECYAEQNQWIVTNDSNTLIVGGFLAGSGTALGSIGVYQGAISGFDFQARNPATNIARVGIWNRVFGIPFMGFYNDNTFNRYGFSYNGSKYMELGRETNAMMYFLQDDNTTFQSIIGRSSTPAYGAMVARNNVLFLENGSGNFTFRNLGFATAAPTSGDWGTGDVLINNGSTTTNVMWVCTSGGSPGTWASRG